MELRHIRYFLAVAEERNFTRAAARVGIGQPPLSQQIRSLEEELGTRLFHRTPQGAELTDAGQAFLPEARALVAQAEKAAQTARRRGRGETGRLRIGFTLSAAFVDGVPMAIRALRRKYPEIALELSEAGTSILLDKLTRREVDVAFVRPGRHWPEELFLHSMIEEKMVIALPSCHRLAGNKSLPLAALAGEPFILFPRAAGVGLFDEILAACREAGFELALGPEAPQIPTICNLVAAELGVSVVPASMAQVRLKGVKYLPIRGPAPVARLAVTTRHQEESPVVKNFLSLVDLALAGRDA